MTCHRATHAEIDLEAFRNNLRFVRSLVGSGVKILSVVKADAYGHGAVPCAKAALEAGADYLGVGIIEEGVELRKNGIPAPILVMGSIFPEEIDDLIRHDLATMLCTRELAEAISAAAGKAGKSVSIHVKIDTGMGRLGASPDDLPGLAEHIRQCKNLRLEGICTHFSSADEDPGYTLRQLSRFKEALDRIHKAGIAIPLIHSANSSALLNFPDSWFNMVRPGLITYGVLPSPNLQSCLANLPASQGGLHPVMQWKSKIIQIKKVPPGAALSYGQKFITQRDSLIATVPVGYADGLSRRLSNKMQALVRGQRVRQVGLVCMDMILLDVTDVPEIKLENEVVIIGRQGDQVITAEENAEWSGIPPYEVLCAVSKRVPRIYQP